MYCDVRGLVTTGIGNLIDPVSAALALHWVRADGFADARPDEVTAEWIDVKRSRQRGKNLILTASSLSDVFHAQLERNEALLAKRWPNWADWPADAQLGAHSCAWAAGAAWAAPKFDAAVAALDFDACAGDPFAPSNDPATRGEAWLRDTKLEDDNAGVHLATLNPGLRPRNVANRLLFWNAARVVSQGLDRDELHWPNKVT